MGVKWLSCLLLSAWICALVSAQSMPSTLRFECSDMFQEWSTKIINAYAAMGVAVECVSLPLARGAQEVAGGMLDGSAIRAKEYGEQFPQLLRVEPPVTVFTILLYKRKGELIDLSNWREHSIAALRGSVLSDQLLVGLDTYRTGSLEAGLKLVSSGRVDLFLGDAQAVPRAIDALGVTNVEAVFPPLATYPMYHYLNPRYRHLVAPISQQLMQMNNE